MLSNKKYSIIIPHHNTQVLLERLIDSIPRREDIEIIVVDDNSDEGEKPNIIRSDVRTIYIDNEHTKGAGRARNIGMDAATGKWILFADADDIFDSQVLGNAMDVHAEDEIDVIVFPIKVVKSDTLEEGPWRDQWFNSVFYSNRTPQQKLLATAACWSKFIRREMLVRHRIRFEEIRYSNDQWFSANVAISATKVVYDENHRIYTLTYTDNSLTRNRGIEAFECRFGAELRMWKLLLSHELITERNTYPRFLSWASSFGVHKVIDTYQILVNANIPNTTLSSKFRNRKITVLLFIIKSFLVKIKLL